MMEDHRSVRAGSEVAPDDVVPALRAAARRVDAATHRLDDAALQAPSRLPAWTRGHVVAHLTHNAEAFVAVTRAALIGEAREVYPGGRAARDAAIERDAGRPAERAIAALGSAQRDLDELWSSLGADDWARPVRFRDGTLVDLLAARWREVEIHHVDLDVGYEDTDWSPAFAAHVIEFLLPRLSAGVVVRADDVDRSWRSDGEVVVTVRGPVSALAAWIAGRVPSSPLTVDGASDLPELGPWP